MRSLAIVLYADKPMPISLSYNALIQGALYDGWRESCPDLHSQGFNSSDKTYRLFTFSQLSGKAKIDRMKKTIAFEGPISLSVRSPIENLLDDLAEALARKQAMRIGSAVFPIINLSTADRLLFPKRALIKTMTPITLHRTLEDGFTEYLDPLSPEFGVALQANSERKAQSVDLDTGAVQLIPIEETLKKRVINFKGTFVNGWAGQFILSANPETMAFLYNTGLGSRNSQGFGMFDIVDKPLI